MNAKEQLREFRQRFDPLLEEYLDERIKDASRCDDFTADGLTYVKKIIMSGGKRLRPALMYHGYRGAGGTNEEAIMRAVVSVELVHSFLLIHDDIMDRDSERHGQRTLHEHFRLKLNSLVNEDEAIHVGNSVALVFGDIVAAFGNHALFSADFEKEKIFEALLYLQEVIALTSVGQLKDIVSEVTGRSSWEETLKMYEYKTARYTVESPLILGAILAGAKEDLRKEISQAARLLGVAFQIRDDVLGVFGSEAETGKSVGSDIREGKITALVVAAREKAERKDIRKLNELLGKKDLTKTDIENFRDILCRSGALTQVENHAVKLVSGAKKILKNLSFKSENKDFLLALADYMTAREK